MKFFIMILSFLSLSFYVKAQEQVNLELGLEAQWYPAGWLLGPVVQYHKRPHHVFFGKLGINLANRYNWSGLNDDEKGVGYGGSLGYRYFFKKAKSTPFIGTRGELYNTHIKWKNDIETPNETNGTTRIVVYQPSFEAGYWLKPYKSAYSFTLSGGFGAELNLATKGKPVGEGGMWLATLTMLKVIK